MKNSNFNMFLRVSTCLIFFFFTQLLFGQSNLFQDVLETDFDTGMSLEQKNKYDKIKKNKH